MINIIFDLIAYLFTSYLEEWLDVLENGVKFTTLNFSTNKMYQKMRHYRLRHLSFFNLNILFLFLFHNLKIIKFKCRVWIYKKLKIFF